MQKQLAALVVTALMTAGVSAAMAQGTQDTAPAFRMRSTTSSLFAGFGEDERRIIKDWFHDSKNELPPALAKREQLSPGMQKLLTKNGTLPPSLEKKIQPLPRVLEMRLQRLPAGRRRVAIGGNVILLDETTSMIVDIVVGVY